MTPCPCPCTCTCTCTTCTCTCRVACWDLGVSDISAGRCFLPSTSTDPAHARSDSADRTPAAKHTSSRSSVQQKRPATRPAPRVRSLRRLLASATRSVYIQRFNNASSIQPCRDERTRVESVGSPSRAKPPPGMKGRCRLGAIVSSGTSLSVIPYLRHGKRDRPAHARVSSRHTCKCECANKALLEGTRTRTR